MSHKLAPMSPSLQPYLSWLANIYGRSGWIWVGVSRNKEDNSWSWITGETTATPIWEPERPESDPNKPYAVLVLHEDASKPANGWFGLANRPADENQIGIMEFDHAPTTDTDGLYYPEPQVRKKTGAASVAKDAY